MDDDNIEFQVYYVARHTDCVYLFAQIPDSQLSNELREFFHPLSPKDSHSILLFLTKSNRDDYVETPIRFVKLSEAKVEKILNFDQCRYFLDRGLNEFSFLMRELVLAGTYEFSVKQVKTWMTRDVFNSRMK